MHELRDQLRTREILESTTVEQREMIKERDVELDLLRTDIETLRKQKDSLLKAEALYSILSEFSCDKS